MRPAGRPTGFIKPPEGRLVFLVVFKFKNHQQTSRREAGFLVVSFARSAQKGCEGLARHGFLVVFKNLPKGGWFSARSAEKSFTRKCETSYLTKWSGEAGRLVRRPKGVGGGWPAYRFADARRASGEAARRAKRVTGPSRVSFCACFATAQKDASRTGISIPLKTSFH